MIFKRTTKETNTPAMAPAVVIWAMFSGLSSVSPRIFRDWPYDMNTTAFRNETPTSGD